MQIIPVESKLKIFGFSTPEEAIAAGQNLPLKRRIQSDSERLKGSTVINGFWTDRDFAIEFSNKFWIHIYNENNFIRWNLLKRNPLSTISDIEGIGSPAIALLWSEGSEPNIMDRSKLLKDRIGKEFVELYCNPIEFCIYTKKQLILCFNAIYRKDNNNEMLYVTEED